jgi:hypothetical protein
MAILNNSNAISTSAPYDINNSLRFRSSASAYLNRTPGTAGNRQIFTWSGWVKRGTLDSGSEYTLFSAGAGGSNYDSFRFTLNQLQFFQGAGLVSAVQTTQVFRDPSAWYHIVLAVDTTQATSTNRIKMYVNGSQITAFASAAYPTQNTSATINNTNVHAVGALWITSPQQYLDGYMAEVNFVDGQALTPSSFGETSTTTGSWIPKSYSGTYGTNGFELNFSDIATTAGSNAGLGKDFSGNGNFYNTNNISVTAGITYDAMIDSPTLTSATVANYCVGNPINNSASGNITFSQANLALTIGVSAQWRAATATMSVSSGKWYWEVTKTNSTTANDAMLGIIADTVNISGNYPISTSALGYTYLDGGLKGNAGGTTAYGATWTNGDVIGIVFDADTGQLTFYKNGVSQGLAFTVTSGNSYYPAFGGASTIPSYALNFGQRPFTYTAPSGFVALNTYNLPDSTIVKGSTVMDATTYTGTGASLAITNTSAFKPDLVWVKGRSGATDHAWYDSVRGTTKQLESNTTTAETTEATGLTAFGTGGFTVGALAQMNTSAATYVGWQWQAGQGSTSSNTSGSITSTVSVSTTAGFSVVTYSANAVNATVGHGLGVAPKMVIVKARNDSGRNWATWHTSILNTQYLNLNTTAATATDATFWNSTSPTSTVFSIGTNVDTNRSGNTYVAYCWAEIAGFSKYGSYTGNGVNGDGPFVFCGFRPKFVLFKNTNTTQDWIIMDTARDTKNKMTQWLSANTSGAEYTDANIAVDFVSNGFKIRTSIGTELNGNGNTIIFMAFAENPFKNANAR